MWQPIETIKKGEAIVYDTLRGVITDAYAFDKDFIYFGFHNNRAYNVTHWMPKPEGPDLT